MQEVDLPACWSWPVPGKLGEGQAYDLGLRPAVPWPVWTRESALVVGG
jgi:hypothetical protein